MQARLSPARLPTLQRPGALRRHMALTAASPTGVVFALRMPHELRAVEVHVPQATGDVAVDLVGEVGRARLTALAARGDCPRPHAVSELDHRHEAVPRGAVPLPC